MQKVLAGKGGVAYRAWSLVSEQRTSSMDIGSVLFVAVDRMFDYLMIHPDLRLNLWTQVREIDAIFVNSIKKDDKK